MRRTCLDQERRHRGRLILGSLPVGGVALHVADPDRRDRLASDNRVEVQQPFLAEQSDIEIDAIQRAKHSHRIRRVFLDMRDPRRIRRLEIFGQRTIRVVVIELLVIEIAARKSMLPQVLRHANAHRHFVDRIHGTGIVNVVRRDQGGVEGARPRGVQKLENVILLVRLIIKNSVHPEVLGADEGREILPLGILGICGRFQRIGADMTEAARHSDAVWPHEVLVIIVTRVGVVANRVPRFLCRLVKVGVWKATQSDDPGSKPVVRTDRQGGPARTDLDAGIFLRVLEGIGRASSVAPVEPKAKSVGVWAGRLGKARLVDQPQEAPSVIAAGYQAGIGREGFQKIKIAETDLNELLPEPIVATGPDEPHVAALDLARSELDSSIHVAEEVFVGGRKARRLTPRLLGFIHHEARAGPGQGRISDQAEENDNQASENKAAPARSHVPIIPQPWDGSVNELIPSRYIVERTISPSTLQRMPGQGAVG